MTNIQNNELTTTLKVEGMSCEHCRAAVTQALRGVGGVEAVSVDLASGLATVQGNTDLASLLEAVAAEGYAATPQ